MKYTVTIESIISEAKKVFNNVIEDNFLPNNTNIRVFILEDLSRIEVSLTNCIIRFSSERAEIAKGETK
jgi:hypothetical protein